MSAEGATPITIRSAGTPDGPPANALEAAGAGTGPTAMADATDGSLAGRLRARQAELSRANEEFGLPGWYDRDNDRYDLVLVARPVADRKRLEEGMTNEQFIVEATAKVLERTDSGELVEIPGGWGGVGQALGMTGDYTHGQAVRAALAQIDGDGAAVESPLRVDGLADRLVAWMMGRRSRLEAALGE